MTNTASLILPARARPVERLVLAGGVAYITTMQVFNPLRSATSDAALFAYAGKLILHGLLPYRDFWDNKPPAIFYTNALGFLLSNGHWLGPTILQAGVLVLSVRLVWTAARDTFAQPLPRYAAFTLATLLLGNPFLLEGAHLTETYQVLPLVATFCLLRPFDPNVLGTRWVLAGATSAIAFLYKPNAVAIAVVAVAATALHLERQRWTWSQALTRLASYAAGAITVLAIVTSLFATYGSARELWFATLAYNVTAYRELFPPPATEWTFERFHVLGSSSLTLRALIGAAVASVGTTAIRIVARARDRALEDRVLLATVWALADVSCAFVTGYAYPHYFVPLSLSLPFAAAPLFATTLERRSIAIAISALAILVSLTIGRDLIAWGSELVRAYPSAERAFLVPSSDEKLAALLSQYLRPNEPILAWGHLHGPQLALGRAPMVPLLSSLHLRSHYGLRRWGHTFEEALATCPPVIIVTWPLLFQEEQPLPESLLMRPLADRFEAQLRLGYARLSFEPKEHEAFIRRDRWDEITTPGPEAPTGYRQKVHDALCSR